MNDIATNKATVADNDVILITNRQKSHEIDGCTYTKHTIAIKNSKIKFNLYISKENNNYVYRLGGLCKLINKGIDISYGDKPVKVIKKGGMKNVVFYPIINTEDDKYFMIHEYKHQFFTVEVIKQEISDIKKINTLFSQQEAGPPPP
jgi:hypothetical protein